MYEAVPNFATSCTKRVNRGGGVRYRLTIFEIQRIHMLAGFYVFTCVHEEHYCIVGIATV